MKLKLLTAGPVQISENILKEISQPIIYHRDPEFIAILKTVVSGIQYVLETKNDILIFTASGTGGMEAVVVNLFSAGDSVLIIEQGKFSARWAEICTCYGLEAAKIELPWGESIDPEKIKQALRHNSEIKAVALTHCETSTGALNDVKAVAQAIHDNSDALIIVDVISTVGVIPFKMDEWKIDVAIASSNKGLLNPPGLAFIALNSRAWEINQHSKLPKYYFSFQKTIDAFKSGIGSPFTPAISLIRGVHLAVEEIKQKRLENIWEQHHKLADAFRTAIHAMGLEILPARPSDSLTVIKIPDGLPANEIIAQLKNDYQIIVSKGQGQLKNRVIRIGHLGELKPEDLAGVITALETILMKMGLKFKRDQAKRVFYNRLSSPMAMFLNPTSNKEFKNSPLMQER